VGLKAKRCPSRGGVKLAAAFQDLQAVAVGCRPRTPATANPEPDAPPRCPADSSASRVGRKFALPTLQKTKKNQQKILIPSAGCALCR